MTEQQLASIKERAERAMPDFPDDVALHIADADAKDADFIAHAREDIPALLEALDAATGRAEALEGALREARREVWNGYYDLPGRGHAQFVQRIDALLGEPSKWIDRYDERGFEPPLTRADQ